MTQPQSVELNPAAVGGANGGWTARRKLLLGAALAALVVLGGFGVYLGRHRGDAATDAASTRYTVSRGAMRVVVTADGTIRSDKTVDIKSEISGMTRILEIVPESTRIQAAGEFLVRLDTSDIEKGRDGQLLKYKQAAAASTQAEKELEIQLAQNESDIRKAQQAKDLAEIDVDKYEKGDFVQLCQQAENDVNIAREELQRSFDKLEWSKKLKEEGYISGSELTADELAHNKAKLDVELAKTKQSVLKEYTYRMESSKRRSTRLETTMELEKVKARAAAQEQKFRSDLDTKREAAALEEKQLTKLERQLVAGVIKSPQPGLVVYASTGRWRGPQQQNVDVGYQVREGESIISLPDLNVMVADVNVPEARRTEVQDNQVAIINVEAQPNNPLIGRVKSRGVMPVQQDFWRRGDVQQFQVVVAVSEPPEWLLPGLRCTAMITTAEKPDVIQVPIQAVFQRDGEDFCYVESGGGLRAVPVLVGIDDDKMVEIKAGLAVGQKVLLAEPENPQKIALERAGFERPRPTVLPEPAPLATQPDATSQADEMTDAEAAQFIARMKSRNPDMAARLEGLSPAEQRKAILEFRKNRPPRGNGNGPPGMGGPGGGRGRGGGPPG